jgi:protein-S-isoprenylcysteine O-methyltransferase Ste14
VLLVKLIIFVVANAGILFVSWKPLSNPRSHGFYRFFAFESTLVLVLLNLENWFRDPFSVHQIVSWLLLLASIILVVHGIYLLRVLGRPKSGIESTTMLVIVGAYKYIRHPLYSSLLFLAWGVFCKAPSIPGSILAVVATAFLVATARIEESENVQKFGVEYTAYIKKTRMFIPFLF